VHISKLMKLVNPIDNLTENVRNDLRISMFSEISPKVHLVVLED
jgi:hypothetical protein